ncbi:MAG: hypothetical protein JNK14_19630 [Chitinophagaceae bacterium]|nr:hypothetical protein [Chitinophagaceae bacterium]
MRCFFLIFPVLVFTCQVHAQNQNFPHSWAGNWKGELQWFKGNANEPQKVVMELRIHPADTANSYTWQLIYGSQTKDNRPYTLIARDTAKGHWAIDEHNGIVLDQFWLANKFCGAFTVGNSTIINSYWMENGKLNVEFYNISAKPVATTGKGTEESPAVHSYKVATYQRAVLSKH